MRLPSTIFKAIWLSLVIFWAVIFTEEFSLDMFPFVALSIIPISICCALTIAFTIYPFFWMNDKDISPKIIFDRYFPFYAITIFGVCTFISIGANFDIYITAFAVSAFITTLKSWTWIVTAK